MDTETLVIDIIRKEVSDRGAELVQDFHAHRNSTILSALPQDRSTLEPLGQRVSMVVDNAGQLCASVFDPEWRNYDKVKVPTWRSITAGLETNDQRVLAVVDALVPEVTTPVGKRAGILTVGELKEALEGIEDHVHVLITADGPDGAVINDGWWNNVADLVPPGDNEGHFTFDLVVGDEFDTRQF